MSIEKPRINPEFNYQYNQLLIACPVFPLDYAYFSSHNPPDMRGAFLVLGPTRGFNEDERKKIGKRARDINNAIDHSILIEHVTAPYETAMIERLPVIQYMQAKIRELKTERHQDIEEYPLEIYPLINFNGHEEVNPLFSLINIDPNRGYEGYVLANQDDKGAVEMKIQIGLRDGLPIFKNVWVRRTVIKHSRNLGNFILHPEEIFPLDSN